MRFHCTVSHSDCYNEVSLYSIYHSNNTKQWQIQNVLKGVLAKFGSHAHFDVHLRETTPVLLLLNEFLLAGLR